MIEKHDTEYGYCRKLGHHLHFKYCRSEQNGEPCSKILDCWFEKFDVRAYMDKHYSKLKSETHNKTLPNKTATIYDLIQKAQARKNQSPD